jgi:hypothetical protein
MTLEYQPELLRVAEEGYLTRDVGSKGRIVDPAD